MDRKKHIIVTGGAGFIGSALVWALNRNRFNNITIVDNLGSSEKWKNLVNLDFKRYIHRSEFFNALRDGLEKPEAIIHLGACSSTTETNADFLLSNNTEYSKRLCEYALSVNARFINASSAATYGDGTQGFEDRIDKLHDLKPLNIYGYSKHLFDLWAKNNDLFDKIASLKFFNVYGPNEYHKGSMTSMILKAFNQISEKGEAALFKSSTPLYGDGAQQRDFVYVKDCVGLILELLDNPELNGLMNVGTGVPRSWNDLVKAVFEAMGKPVKIKYIDMPENLRNKYQNFTKAKMDWQKKCLPQFHFRSLELGVKDYVQNYLQKDDPYLR